jgi:hypothetical protein
VDVDDNAAYNISTRQTPVINDPNKTLMDWYLNHLEQDRYALWPTVHYIAHDGNYQPDYWIVKPDVSKVFMSLRRPSVPPKTYVNWRGLTP